MLSQQMRRQFLQFFKDKQHRLLPSSSVVPNDDPTLLFTNAGMNQFKDVFLGKSARDYTRAATSQKCLRVGGKHNDLDNVGHTERHLTFFEMLGNFSFGDYFKKEAIEFAWEMTTSIFQFDPEKVWITVFREDDESFELWKKWVPEKKIVRMDEKDNFWAMGDTGPCGPCSELYFDKGSVYGSAKSPKEDLEGKRYLEFWNLVFMQFNRDAQGKMTPLPKPCIDTGAGLERVVSLKMGVDDLFQTDVLRDLIAQVETISKKPYQQKDLIMAPAYHVIADHIRSLAFAISDGAVPSNVERGYVLRKLLRRAVRYGRMLGLQKPFLAEILPRLVENMGDDYPELRTNQNRIAEILTLEEEGFLRTLKRGGNILSQIIDKANNTPQKQISGEDAFQLKDTYGLPLEEILLIAKDYGVQVNLDAYALLEERAKELSKSAHVSSHEEAELSVFSDYLEKHPPSRFVGFEQLEADGVIKAIIAGGSFAEVLKEGEEGGILLDKSPFYAEKGGQVGDIGVIEYEGGIFTVTDCHSPYPGIILHKGKVTQGTLLVGESIQARVNTERRKKIESNHTATHLLHYALQQVLGAHIKQAGSLVDDKRLRFDFNHHKPLSQEEIRAVETLVNNYIRQGTAVDTYELSFEEAQKKPQIKQFFGDKYGSTVRVVDIDFSKELCGGTHTHNTYTIGLFRIKQEGSIASGVRRIEAVTGSEAECFMYSHDDLIAKGASLLKAAPSQFMEKFQHLIEEHKHFAFQLREFKKKSLHEQVEKLTSQIEKVGSVSFLSAIVALEGDLLNDLLGQLSSHLPSGVLLIGNQGEEKCQLIAKVSSDLVQKGIQANALIKELAPLIEGSGGGKPEMAQAGGKRGDQLPKALLQARQWLTKQL